jgi:sporulation protein YlmC with PRC-barrel domain
MGRATGAAMAFAGMTILLGALPAGAQTPPPPASSTAEAPPSAPQPPAATPAKPPPAPANIFRAKTGEFRAATLIGATVYNDQKQTIGTLSDILIDQNDKVTSAVLSVGGFLGVGSRLVVVPFTELHIEADRIVLPGATKVSLENLSAYQAGG